MNSRLSPAHVRSLVQMARGGAFQPVVPIRRSSPTTPAASARPPSAAPVAPIPVLPLVAPHAQPIQVVLASPARARAPRSDGTLDETRDVRIDGAWLAAIVVVIVALVIMGALRLASISRRMDDFERSTHTDLVVQQMVQAEVNRVLQDTPRVTVTAVTHSRPTASGATNQESDASTDNCEDGTHAAAAPSAAPPSLAAPPSPAAPPSLAAPPSPAAPPSATIVSPTEAAAPAFSATTATTAPLQIVAGVDAALEPAPSGKAVHVTCADLVASIATLADADVGSFPLHVMQLAEEHTITDNDAGVVLAEYVRVHGAAIGDAGPALLAAFPTTTRSPRAAARRARRPPRARAAFDVKALGSAVPRTVLKDQS